MGEYARFNGEQIKIGTCEDMYYLRYDQRGMVQRLSGNVNVNSSDVYSVRFRFPWPDEDDILPGAFKDYDRSIAIPGATVPDGVEHNTIQFQSVSKGLLCSLPCPNGVGPHFAKIHRNGYAGDVRLVRQRLLRDGRLVPILICGACGAMWRCEEPEEIEAIAKLMADYSHSKEFYGEISRRIMAGAAGIAVPV